MKKNKVLRIEIPLDNPDKIRSSIVQKDELNNDKTPKPKDQGSPFPNNSRGESTSLNNKTTPRNSNPSKIIETNINLKIKSNVNINNNIKNEQTIINQDRQMPKNSTHMKVTIPTTFKSKTNDIGQQLAKEGTSTKVTTSRDTYQPSSPRQREQEINLIRPDGQLKEPTKVNLKSFLEKKSEERGIPSSNNKLYFEKKYQKGNDLQKPNHPSTAPNTRSKNVELFNTKKTPPIPKINPSINSNESLQKKYSLSNIFDKGVSKGSNTGVDFYSPGRPRPANESIIDQDIISVDEIKNWKVFCAKLRDLMFFLFKMKDSFKNNTDPYDVIREYVDFIQDKRFDDLIRIFVNKKFLKPFIESFILERWLVFSLFYILLEKANINYYTVIKVVEIIYESFILYLKLIEKLGLNSPNLDFKYSFKALIEKGVEPYHKEFAQTKVHISQILLNVINFNREKTDFLESVARISKGKIRDGVSRIIKGFESKSIDKSLDELLDSFCDYFVEKGIVNVEYSDGLNKNLSELRPPFITTKRQIHKYSLVLDLDETLIHFNQSKDGGQVLLRPHVHRFLEEVSKDFEIIIWTAAQQVYADWILDRLDRTKAISYRLYRQHTDLCGTTNIKDLSKIGRELNRVIIIDNIPDNFRLHSENGIYVKSWFHDTSDQTLLELIPVLKEVVEGGHDDVRIALRILRENMMINFRKGEQPLKNIKLNI